MGELNGLRSDCVDLKRSRIFVNRSLTVLKGASCSSILTQSRLLLDGLTAAADTGKKRGEIPEVCDQWVRNFMRCQSFGRSPYNRAPQTSSVR